MEESRLLKKYIAPYFHWNQAHLTLLSLLIFGLIRTRTVNLAIVAESFGTHVQIHSHYKRIQRFLSNDKLSMQSIAHLIEAWFLPEGRWLLCLDRTHWKFGRIHINILVLAVAVQGVAIPIFWVMLKKAGNSNTQERINLIGQFISHFGSERIQCLTADREFRGQDWVCFLQQNNIPFCIRIPTNTQVFNRHQNKKLPVKRLFSLKPGESMVLNQCRTIWGISVHLACFRSTDDWVIIACDQAPAQALTAYQQRWAIETLFQCLKGRGFNLEETHLTKAERIEKLFAVLTIAFCWCYKMGEWRHEAKPITKKNHGRSSKTIFRYGAEWLRALLHEPHTSKEKLRLIIMLLPEPDPDIKIIKHLFDIKTIN